VPHLLQSNVPPSEDETLLIVQFIQHARLELENARLIKEASGTRSSELRYIANTVESHRAVLSAVRRVPLELLQEIFLHMIPHTSYEGYNSLHLDLQGDIPSWSFSQVSKFWRSAATHCPSLWRRLPHIHLDKRSTYKPDFVDILKRIMERTGDGPICVYFSSAKCDGPIDHPALDLLLAHSHRWRGARISLSLSSFHALRSVENRLPLLEGLIIHIVPTYCVRDEGFPETITFFRDAPSLCRAYIHGARAKIFALPQSYQLVEYQQEYCHPLQTHLALGLFQPGVSSFDSLTRLSITNFDPDNPWPNISLNNLVYLQIQFNHVTWLGWYLDALTLPCIEEIEISAHNPLLTASVSSILQRSHFPSTTLRRLYLRSPGYSATLELVALIRLAPFLTHLNVTTPPIEDLELLSTDASLAPCLQVCEFIASEEFPLTGEVIRQINIFAKLRCDLPQNIPTEENNDMEHLEHCMLIVYIHFDNYVPRNYAEQVHDWSADSQYLQELIELGRQLITASSVTRPFNGENKRSSRRKITSLLRKVNAYKVKTSKEIIVSRDFSHESIKEHVSNCVFPDFGSLQCYIPLHLLS